MPLTTTRHSLSTALSASSSFVCVFVSEWVCDNRDWVTVCECESYINIHAATCKCIKIARFQWAQLQSENFTLPRSNAALRYSQSGSCRVRLQIGTLHLDPQDARRRSMCQNLWIKLLNTYISDIKGYMRNQVIWSMEQVYINTNNYLCINQYKNTTMW